MCHVTCYNGTIVLITIITQAAFFNYWSGDRRYWQLLWYSSVPPVLWPHLHPPQFKGCELTETEPRQLYLCQDILLQVTTRANRDVFKIMSLFGNGFMMVVEMRVVFWVCYTVAFCLMSRQDPCELLQTLKMEAVHHPSKMWEERKKTFHNVKPQKTKVTL